MALRKAGGYQVVKGSPDARNFYAYQRRPWIAATRQHIQQQLAANDWQTRLMCEEVTRDFTAALAPFSMSPGKHGNPLQRAHDIIGWIIQQSRFTALDILTVALATDIMYRHWEGTPLRSAADAWRRPYYRAVQIGKAIHYLLRVQVRVYEHDNGHGEVRREVVRYKKGLTSRYVAQRLQGLCERIYSEFLNRHSREIASMVNQQEAHTRAFQTQP